jgi:hypothetical protein
LYTQKVFFCVSGSKTTFFHATAMETAQEVDTFQSTTLKQGAALQKQDGKSLKREEKGKEENMPPRPSSGYCGQRGDSK